MASHIITPTTFDVGRIRYENRRVNFKTGNFSVVSTVKYLYPDGKVDSLYFQIPRCRSNGILIGYEWKKEQIPVNIKEFKLGLSLTTQKTMNEPLKEEQEMLDFLTALYKDAYRHASTEQTIKFLQNQGYPGPAMYLKQGESGMRRIYTEPSVAEQEVNGQKTTFEVPHKLYVKLQAYKPYDKPNPQIGDWKFRTTVRGPGNLNKNPLEYLKVTGYATTVVHYKEIWYGSHGSTSIIGAHLQLFCDSINYTPYVPKPKPHMLPPNLDPIQSSEQLEDDEFLGLEGDISGEFSEDKKWGDMAGETGDFSENLNQVPATTPPVMNSSSEEPEVTAPRKRRVKKMIVEGGITGQSSAGSTSSRTAGRRA